MKTPELGAILYNGPSAIDGSPIVAILTGFRRGGSKNRKTGRMLQLWIIRADINPVKAIKSGDDYGICGNCAHRGITDGITFGIGRTCYVNAGNAPHAVYDAFQRGRYDDWTSEEPAAVAAMLTGLAVRLGAYGDPAALPVGFFTVRMAKCAEWTGYTHQWRSRPDLRLWCMASVDSDAERNLARAIGWRYFAVMPEGTVRQKGEAHCPASKERGAKLSCAQCLACNGTGKGRAGSVIIWGHGSAAIKAALPAHFARANALEAKP